MATASSASSSSFPRERPFWLQLPANFKSHGVLYGAEDLAALDCSKARGSPPGGTYACRRRWPGTSGSIATIEVLAVSFLEGAQIEVKSHQADALLRILLQEKEIIEYVDDSDWTKFPEVGEQLKKIASKEECITGAFCASSGTWAFGVGMMSLNRRRSATIALAVSLALQAHGPSGEDLLSFSELAAFAKLAHRHFSPVQIDFHNCFVMRAIRAIPAYIVSRLIGKQLRLTSSCAGAVEGWATLDNRGSDASWDGFCPCCKRPVSIALADALPMSKRKKRKIERCAYVCAVWGDDPQYVLGAMVLGYSLRRTGTPHDLVLLHTADVPSGSLDLLKRVGWRIVPVGYVHASPMLFSNPGNRFAGVFTKLRALELVEYSKVLLLDSDLLVQKNIDDLFELPAPAAMHRGQACGYEHGAKIDGRMFFGGFRPGYDYNDETCAGWREVAVRGPWSWGQSGGINAGVMLFSPDMETAYQCLNEVGDGMHPEHIRGSGPEQDYLSRFFAGEWTHISVSYNFQLHQMFYALGGIDDETMSADRTEFLKDPDKIKVYHFSADPKPWMRHLDIRYSTWTDAEWRKEVMSRFSGYRAYVERNAEDLLSCGEVGEVPAWALKASVDLVTSSMELWDEAYVELAAQLQETDLANAVVNSSPEYWWYKWVPPPKISSKDNAVWDLAWAELSTEQQQAATSFGWNSHSWEERYWFCPKGIMWCDLSCEVRCSLEILGETAESWDRWTNE